MAEEGGAESQQEYKLVTEAGYDHPNKTLFIVRL